MQLTPKSDQTSPNVYTLILVIKFIYNLVSLFIHNLSVFNFFVYSQSACLRTHYKISLLSGGGNLQALHDPIPILGVTIRFQNDSWSTFFPQWIFTSLQLYILTKMAVSMLFVYSWNLQ